MAQASDAAQGIRPDFAPDFVKTNGLVPAIAQCAATGEVLMLAWMNQEAWDATLATGEAHYFSRSRGRLWHKGGTSGHTQHIKAVRLDCDSDTVLLLVEQKGGAACHEGYRSCFYRELKDGETVICSPRVFDPKEVYK
jgi:phosphoribosyl-AMP cyclohydrolase